jgi:hypothetical protein
MEQAVAIAVFAVCAAVCVKILVVSHIMATNAIDTRDALLVAENAAESFKAFSGDVNAVARVMGGEVCASSGDVVVFYDGDWQPVTEASADFVLRLTPLGSEPTLRLAEVTVEKRDTGREMVALAAAAQLSGSHARFQLTEWTP